MGYLQKAVAYMDPPAFEMTVRPWWHQIYVEAAICSKRLPTPGLDKRPQDHLQADKLHHISTY